MSPSHFIRQFDAVFGATPHQFRIDSRLELAKLLLAGGNHSVTDVCMESGFPASGTSAHCFFAASANPIVLSTTCARLGERARSTVYQRS